MFKSIFNFIFNSIFSSILAVMITGSFKIANFFSMLSALLNSFTFFRLFMLRLNVAYRNYGKFLLKLTVVFHVLLFSRCLLGLLGIYSLAVPNFWLVWYLVMFTIFSFSFKRFNAFRRFFYGVCYGRFALAFFFLVPFILYSILFSSSVWSLVEFIPRVAIPFFSLSIFFTFGPVELAVLVGRFLYGLNALDITLVLNEKFNLGIFRADERGILNQMPPSLIDVIEVGRRLFPGSSINKFKSFSFIDEAAKTSYSIYYIMGENDYKWSYSLRDHFGNGSIREFNKRRVLSLESWQRNLDKFDSKPLSQTNRARIEVARSLLEGVKQSAILFDSSMYTGSSTMIESNDFRKIVSDPNFIKVFLDAPSYFYHSDYNSLRSDEKQFFTFFMLVRSHFLSMSEETASIRLGGRYYARPFFILGDFEKSLLGRPQLRDENLLKSVPGGSAFGEDLSMDALGAFLFQEFKKMGIKALFMIARPMEPGAGDAVIVISNNDLPKLPIKEAVDFKQPFPFVTLKAYNNTLSVTSSTVENLGLEPSNGGEAVQKMRRLAVQASEENKIVGTSKPCPVIQFPISDSPVVYHRFPNAKGEFVAFPPSKKGSIDDLD